MENEPLEDKTHTFAFTMIENFMASLKLLHASNKPEVAYFMLLTVIAQYMGAVSPENRKLFLMRLNYIIDIIGNEVYEDTEDLIAKMKDGLSFVEKQDDNNKPL